MILRWKCGSVYYEIYTKQVPCQLALPLLNISNSISISIPVTIKQIGYINITATSPKIVNEYDQEIPQS